MSLSECSLCLESMEEATTLPSGHSFCRTKCLSKWLKSNTTCPSCRNYIPQRAFFFDRVLRESIDGLNQKPKELTICNFCLASDATIFCSQCSDHLCQQCSTHLHQYKIFQDHNIVPLEEKSPLPVVKCPHHNTKNLEYFCSQCKVAICDACALSQTHVAHNKCLVPLPNAKEDVSEDVMGAQNSLNVSHLQEPTERVQHIEQKTPSTRQSFEETRDEPIYDAVFKYVNECFNQSNNDKLRPDQKDDLNTITSKDWCSLCSRLLVIRDNSLKYRTLCADFLTVDPLVPEHHLDWYNILVTWLRYLILNNFDPLLLPSFPLGIDDDVICYIIENLFSLETIDEPKLGLFCSLIQSFKNNEERILFTKSHHNVFKSLQSEQLQTVLHVLFTTTFLNTSSFEDLDSICFHYVSPFLSFFECDLDTFKIVVTTLTSVINNRLLDCSIDFNDPAIYEESEMQLTELNDYARIILYSRRFLLAVQHSIDNNVPIHPIIMRYILTEQLDSDHLLGVKSCGLRYLTSTRGSFQVVDFICNEIFRADNILDTKTKAQLLSALFVEKAAAGVGPCFSTDVENIHKFNFNHDSTYHQQFFSEYVHVFSSPMDKQFQFNPSFLRGLFGLPTDELGKILPSLPQNICQIFYLFDNKDLLVPVLEVIDLPGFKELIDADTIENCFVPGCWPNIVLSQFGIMNPSLRTHLYYCKNCFSWIDVMDSGGISQFSVEQRPFALRDDKKCKVCQENCLHFLPRDSEGRNIRNYNQIIYDHFKNNWSCGFVPFTVYFELMENHIRNLIPYTSLSAYRKLLAPSSLLGVVVV
ncbi:hypothetical protein P9112_009508 [Eukaryota sp. TZLM1-RC]